MEFLGRAKEIELFERAYRSRQSEMIVVYGRRRVGKSELILHATRGKSAIYFLGKRSQPALQIRELLQEAALVLREPLLATYPAEGWRDAITTIASRYRGKGKLVLVLDELQWAAEASPELPNVLQELWDRKFRDDGRTMLILCGSYVGFMEREILGQKSPLFGRRTAQILLRPFGYREAALFHPSYSLVDRVKTYFLCGGIPLYLRYFSQEKSVEQNICANLLAELAPLFREPDFLLREELREVESYYAILMAMAHGAVTAGAISQATHIGERALHYYFQQLVELGYLARRHPLTDKPGVARHVRYDLVDPLLRFWFRFVYPNTSFIVRAGPERALADRIRPQLDAYFGHCFERLCREALPDLYDREGVTAGFEVGEYWDKTVQIDVLGLRADGVADVCECKWGPVRSRAAVEAELVQRAAAYPNEPNRTLVKRVFTRDEVPERAQASDVRWHDLADLYGQKAAAGRKRTRSVATGPNAAARPGAKRAVAGSKRVVAGSKRVPAVADSKRVVAGSKRVPAVAGSKRVVAGSKRAVAGSKRVPAVRKRGA